MEDNYSYLVIPFPDFEERIKAAVAAGEAIRKRPNDDKALKEFEDLKNQWIAETKEAFESSFADKRNCFTFEFKAIGAPPRKAFDFTGQAFNAYRDEIRMKCHYMEEAVRTIALCDYFRDKEHTEMKTGLTTIQKASLLLEKLYQFGDDGNHLAKLILVGNGVVLRTQSEALDIANYLEQHGLIDISHGGGNYDVFVSISTHGKIVYEEQTNRTPSPDENQQEKKNALDMTSIFIVHGQNHQMKETVARAVEKLGFKAVILHEMPNQGRTVIEKFTDHSDEVQYAIVLLSADDFAYPKNLTAGDGKLRPRQNVVFELGYFIGKLGRDRVFPLYETLDNFEIHSDFAGVVLVPFDSKGSWKMDLGKELEALGVNVDWKALMK